MGRESSTNLEQAALSFLSAIDPERGIDAALFLRRTGLVLASWTREGIRLDVVSVMAATMLASIDTILEALGGSASESVARSAVRKTVRELVTQLSKIASEMGSPLEGTTAHPRVKVRPPR